MLDEPALRRETFQLYSVPVTLADGQVWFFPPRGSTVYPVVETVDQAIGPQVVGCQIGSAHGRAFDDLLAKADAAIRSAGSAENGEGVMVSVQLMMQIAHDLLAINYDLADADYGPLIPYEFGSLERLSMWKAILAIARGERLSTLANGRIADGCRA